MIDAMTSPAGMLFLGLLSHILKDMLRVRIEGGKGASIGPVEYFRAYPIQTILAAIGALVGYAILDEMGELSRATAFTAGYMANSFADMMGKRTANRFGRAE